MSGRVNITEAIARAWASIDGKLEAFERERNGMDYDDPDYTGHYEGYLAEADELMARSGAADIITGQAKLIEDMFAVISNRCDRSDPKVKDVLERAVKHQQESRG